MKAIDVILAGSDASTVLMDARIYPMGKDPKKLLKDLKASADMMLSFYGRLDPRKIKHELDDMDTMITVLKDVLYLHQPEPMDRKMGDRGWSSYEV